MARLGIALYVVAVAAPVVLMLVIPDAPRRGFWTELSVALGFVGLALMGLQLIVAGRLRALADAYASDELYKHHRQVSIVATVLAFAHPIILFIVEPATLQLLNFPSAPLRAQAATVGMVLLVVVVVTSVWRGALRIPYHVWRIVHTTLTVALIGLFVAHAVLVNTYLADPVIRAYGIALLVVWVAAFVYTRFLRPVRISRLPYRVVEVIPERGNSWSLVLEPAGHDGIAFRAGQFAWISVERSALTLIDNPFSFSSSAEHPERVSFTIAEAGDFTASVRDIAPGTRVHVDGPFGTFDLERHEGPGYAFVAGGSGIGPVMSMLRTMADRGDERDTVVLYGANTWEGITFREEMDALGERPNVTVVYVLDDPHDGWEGETGFVDRDLIARHVDRLDTREFFVCGPEPMVHALHDALDELGVPEAHIHTEHYVMA